MKNYIDKAAVLIEALPYIQKLQGKKILIKYGGSVISEELYCESVLRDVVFMRTVGMHPIIVHGGGKILTQRLKEANIDSHFVHGLRYTSKETIAIVSKVMREEVSKHIGELLKRFGATPAFFNSDDCQSVRCVKKKEHLGADIDLGFVGEITEVDSDPIMEACAAGKVPVISPLGADTEGQLYNINADIMAGELCAALKAQKMVYLSDIPGILKDVNDPKSLISSIDRPHMQTLLEEGVIREGMIPKIQACLKSLEAGAKKTHIIDGRLQHSLLLEIFTDKGVGTEIV